MKIQRLVALAGAALLLGCGAGEAALDTDAQIASYAVGIDVGRSLSPAAGHLDIEAFARGVDDALAERDPVLADSILQGALQRFSQTIQESMTAELDAAGEGNRQEGEAYMAENAQRPEVTTTDSGLQYEVLEEGAGPRPVMGDSVTVDYTGTLIDGTEFDSGTMTFQLQEDGMISGFTEAVQLIPVGGRYRFVIPGDLAYGPQGHPSGTIGPSETLIFEIELDSIP